MSSQNEAGPIVLKETPAVETSRYSHLQMPLKIAFLTITFIGVVLNILYVFNVSFGGRAMLDIGYYYFLIALFNSCVLVVIPGRKKDKKAPWYDIAAGALVLGIGIYFFLNAMEINTRGWNPPTMLNAGLALIFILGIMEGGRRIGGNIYAAICLILGLYPLIAGYMPGVLSGINFSPMEAIALNAFSTNGLIGIPAKTIGDVLIGFLIFAGVLIATGAGEFFLNIAFIILGRFRGGPAKVAVLASCLFGSISGSAISNVVAAGSVTIPAMKRIGYPAKYAAAIEACASTGGIVMPPVMGAVAFVMAVVLGVPYASIMVAAIIPALLFYFGLLMQADLYASKVGLKGLPKVEIPPLWKTLKEGWQFIAVLAFLVWGLVYMRWDAKAPYYASVLMIALSFINRKTWMTPRRLLKTLKTVGEIITESMGVIIPIGFIVCGLTATGVAFSFVSQLVEIGGTSVFLLLLLGSAACFVMGMAGMIVPAYIFLAVTLAPAVIQIGGLNTMAVHMFILYNSMLACITPPVAVASFVAANIAGCNPISASVYSARLGIVLFIIPFFFVYNPALILQGSALDTVYLTLLCFLGIFVIAVGMEGYIYRIGRMGWIQRILLIGSGFIVACPGFGLLPSMIGIAAAVVIIVASALLKRLRLGTPTAAG